MDMYVIGLLIYFLVLVILGIYLSRKNLDFDSYFYGRRKLGSFLIFFTVTASWFGAASTIATVEDAQQEVYPGETFGKQFPLSWYHHFEGGRQWYTALGHDPGFYNDPLFIGHLRGGILWVLGETDKTR